MMKLNALYDLPERSILIRLGVVLVLLGILALVSMTSTIIIAENSKGEAEAINLAGSLRMQSFRIASLLLDRSDPNVTHHATEIVIAMNRLEATLLAPRLAAIVPRDSRDQRRMAYGRIVSNWNTAMRPLFNEHLKLFKKTAVSADTAITSSMPTQRSPQFLPSVTIFVDRVDRFVKLLEQNIESKNLLLRLIQGSALALTLMAAVITVFIVQKRVFTPLRSLVRAAKSIGDRDLTARVTYTAPDELGRVGLAFNLMADELSHLYADLEQRVQDKTATLERANRSLDLLYKSVGRLYQLPVASETYDQLLQDVEETIGVGSGTVCLAQQEILEPGATGVALRMVHGDQELCDASACDEAFCGGARRWRKSGAADRAQVLSLPLRDMEGHYGVLQWAIPGGTALEPWQLHLLEALCLHMGNSIGAARRVEEKRRFALHKERTIIARELHDSLAQALSYMKIQVSRLRAALDQQETQQKSQAIVEELGVGLDNAYRQLRELLSTFRLRIEHGLNEVLNKTIAEFSSRGNIPIDLAVDLEQCQLTPNEEIHLLQIVRESLANVIHHARADRAEISVRSDADGMVNLVIHDNGLGLDVESADATIHHYGLQIMEERAQHLNGTISVQRRPEGGTRVALRFAPAGRSNPETRLVGGSA